MSYIFMDCEMGSVELDYSLLSSYFLITDDNFKPIDELELLVMPDDGKFIVCGEAMGVNKIDLYAHSLKAKPYKEAGTILYNWLDRLTNKGQSKLTPVGHGVYGDIKFIQKYLLSRGSWEKFVSYRVLDTSGVCQFLKACGRFPEDVSGSLTSLAKHFYITVDENSAHDAKYDTHLTLQVFLALRKEIMEKNIQYSAAWGAC
jgi:oligoribonuclease (3'-5' exoribonuclease)